MKKFFLFTAALCAAWTVNAGVVNIDLSKATLTSSAVTMNLENEELTVNYDVKQSWGQEGVTFALDDLDVTELAFEYKGDESVATWVSFIVYLVDSQGGMWYSSEADLSISEWNAEWESKAFMPTDVLWDSTKATEPVKPFKQLGFLANPSDPTVASFAIRDIKLTVPGTEAIDHTAVQSKAIKVIRDGQVLILRDGKTFNALGAEMK